jgi:hypothetical protein
MSQIERIGKKRAVQLHGEAQKADMIKNHVGFFVYQLHEVNYTITI